MEKNLGQMQYENNVYKSHHSNGVMILFIKAHNMCLL